MSNPNASFVRRGVKYLAQHWFKFSIAALLLILCFKQDLSFRINFHPATAPAAQPAVPLPAADSERAQRDQFSITSAAAAPTDRAAALDFSGRRPATRPVAPSLNTVRSDIKEDHLQRFAKVAVAEQEKFGIPASVLLGCALLNSTAGTYAPAEQLNNYFALPCGDAWTGASAESNGSCFRQYESAWASFRDHSQYLTTGRFADLRAAAGTHYQQWAQELDRRDYSAQPDFARQLVQVIEAYGLAELDR